MPGQDFIEEEKHLKKTIKDIDKEINTFKHANKLLEDDLDTTWNTDYDDASRYQQAKQRFDNNNLSINELKEIRRSPYFGRLVLEDTDSGEELSTYLGKKVLSIDHEIKVMDWRTPLGDVFYKRDLSSKFNVDGYNYKLVLKREFEIKESVLKICKTLYDLYDLGSLGEVVDSFLIDVLKDKRRDKRVTDIIVTIQENQNKILRQPINKNFVVQGCAGSGKTMILLHRLSYILYNKLLKTEDIRIITPNLFFDSQIDELSKELEISSIKRMTVDDYYCYLYEKITGIKTEDEIMPEYNLDKEYLKYMYSEQLVEDLTKEVDSYFDLLDEELKEKDVYEVFKTANFPLVRKSENGLGPFIEAVNARTKAIEAAYRNKAALEKLNASVSKFEEKIANKIIDLRMWVSNSTTELNSFIHSNHSKVKALQKENESIIEELNEIDEKLKVIRIKKEVAASVDYVMSHDNDLSNYIKEICLDGIKELDKLNKDFSNTSFFNFGARNRIDRQIKNKSAELQEEFETAYDLYHEEHKEDDFSIQIEDLNSALDYNRSEIKKINESIDESKSKLEEYEYMKTRLSSIKKPLDLMEFLADYTIDYFKEANNSLNEEFKVYSRNKETLKNYSDKNKTNFVDITDITKEQTKTLKEIDGILSEFSYENLSRKIQTKFLHYGRNMYRHVLYARLLFASLYYSNTKFEDKMLCFDEAQDLSPREIQLFRELNDRKCIFNFYGDVKQAVNDYELIQNWKNELKCIDQLNVFELNQNYRNSSEITEYCNKIFGSKMDAVGITENNNVISDYDFKQSVDRIIQLSKEDQKRRCVIIYSERNEKTVEFLQELSRDYRMTWNRFEKGTVSIMPVRLCKGLEFDAVLVIDNGMNENEKYISYTRALDNLVVYSKNFE